MKNIFLIAFICCIQVCTAQKDTATSVTNFILHTAKGDIKGSLSVPATSKKVPVVMIIAGSGPFDRNCNSLAMGVKSNAYKMLADSLLQYQIASLRYDKRGIAESTPAGAKEADLRFDDMVDDAAAFIELLKKDTRFSSVIVLGHSEGSLVGMIAAQKAGANKYISLAGAGFPAHQIIKKQLEPQGKKMQDMCYPVLDSLANGFIVTNAPKSMYALFRPSIQPYLISWFKYNPCSEVAKLKIPVAVIQGNKDIQVSDDDAQALHKAATKSVYFSIDGMTHILKAVPEGMQQGLGSYNKPDQPILSSFVQAVVGFIKSK
jgi:hypothetical protein